MTAVSAPRRGLRWAGRVLRTGAFYLLLLILLALGAMLFSESAPRWLWQQAKPAVPGLELNGIGGSLAGGLTLESLSWRNESLAVRVEQLAVAVRFRALLRGQLALDYVRSERVAVTVLKPSEPAVFVPPRLALPFAWALPELAINTLQWTAYNAEPLQLESLALDAEGEATGVTVHRLSAAYARWQLAAQAALNLRDQWPLAATLMLNGPDLASQRIQLDGDLSVLRARLRGPAQYPIALEARVNALLPTLPFRGRLSWPQWQPPGQDDWRLEPGAMTFAGSTAQGELALDLRASLREQSTLDWPANAPRRAHLSGPLRWRLEQGALQATLAWVGQMGRAPWRVSARYQQDHPEHTQLAMSLADAQINVSGWPSSGIKARVAIARLQRFQSSVAGAFNAQATWRGHWPDGQGKIQLNLSNLGAPGSATPWLSSAQLRMDGGLAAHRVTAQVHAPAATLSLSATGTALLAEKRWHGQLASATLTPAQGRWQLRKPAAIELSADTSALAPACWRQVDPALSAWQVCTDATLSPQQWLATLRATAPTGGELEATLRRDPSAADPALDADVRWQAINLAALPMALPDNLSLTGQSQGQVRVSGSLAEPRVHGQWGLDASVQWPRYGLSWPSVNLDGELLGQRTRFSAALTDTSAGTLAITGEAAWQPALTLAMQVTGDQLAFAYAPWVQGRVSPALNIAWQDQQLRVAGDVLVNRADITLKALAAGAPKPSPDVVIVRNSKGEPVATTASEGGLPLDLHVRVLLGDAISLTGYGLAAGLRGQLLLTQSPSSTLAANGDISLKPNAQFAAYGQRLDIEQGRLLFAGPLSSPDIRLMASREVDGVRVGVTVMGQAPKPTVTLTSDSPMSQDEILSYLVLGRSLGNNTEPSAADKQALALSAALNVTGKTGAIGLLGQRLGISDFAIGTQGDSEATEVAVSGRLSPKLWLSIGRGVFQPSQSVTVRYQINRRLSLEALSALESAITLFYSWRF